MGVGRLGVLGVQSQARRRFAPSLRLQVVYARTLCKTLLGTFRNDAWDNNNAATSTLTATDKVQIATKYKLNLQHCRFEPNPRTSSRIARIRVASKAAQSHQRRRRFGTYTHRLVPDPLSQRLVERKLLGRVGAMLVYEEGLGTRQSRTRRR